MLRKSNKDRFNSITYM